VLDILKIIKNEVVNDEFVARCKTLVDTIDIPGKIVFVCNTEQAIRHMITIPIAMMGVSSWTNTIGFVAKLADADAIVTVVTLDVVEEQRCMTISIETLIDYYARAYPYERVDGKMKWKESRQVELPDRYGTLLPVPVGMAQA
jgi:hypothetical protein